MFRTKVTVIAPSGRRVYTVHAERALSMVQTGEASRESPGIIRLTQTVRLTSDMYFAPKVDHGQKPDNSSSSAFHRQLHPRGGIRQFGGLSALLVLSRT